MGGSGFICDQIYPTSCVDFQFSAEKARAESVIELVKNIRVFRNDNNIEIGKTIILKTPTVAAFDDFIENIKKLAGIGEVQESSDGSGNLIVSDLGIVYADLNIDKKELKAKLEKELESIDFEISRSEKMLNNPNFVAKAPASLVELEKEKIEKNKALKEMLLGKIQEI